MAVSDQDVLSQMAAGRSSPPPGAPPSPTATPSPTAPAGAPMAGPEPRMGNVEGAKVNLAMALDLIEQSLPALGSESAEGKQALNAIRALSGLLGPRKPMVNELQPAEIQQLVGSLPQGAGAPPEMKAMMGGGAPGAGGPPPMPAPGMGAPQPMAA